MLTNERIFRNRYAVNEQETVEEMWERVVVAIASAEDEPTFWTERFSLLLKDFRFVPAGRILSNAGTSSSNQTLFNCFVLPMPDDSRGGILETLRQQVEIMSSGGGVGINISSIRYNGANVKGVSGKASGAPSWGGLFAYATGLISQGGSRRGALGLVLEDWHPDLLEFIKMKDDENTEFSNCNISVALSDRFMDAVKNDHDWNLVFPSQDCDFDGQKFTKGKLEVIRTLKAREIFDAIVKQAHKNGEPGVWFIDTVNRYSNSVTQYRLRCPNPCFEEPLPPFGSCCLGSINLPKHFSGGAVDWAALAETVQLAVRFLDDVLECSFLFDEQKEVMFNERRIGLGSIGLAELLLKLEIRYGSPLSLTFIEQLFSFIANHAYVASSKLAVEKGSFLSYDFSQLVQSAFFTQLEEETKNIVRQNGLRNLTLLSQAPGGTISSLVSTSSGIEPYFDWVTTVNTRIGTLKETARPFHDFRSQFPSEALPDYFKTANEISWEEHIMVQAAIQKFTDASVSKTINLPHSATVEDVANCIFRLHSLNCKGAAVYRDGSREKQAVEKSLNTRTTGQPDQPIIKPLPDFRRGITVTRKTNLGNLHATMNFDEAALPFEIFLEVGKSGSDIKALTEAIGRLISLLLRLNLSTDKFRLVELVIEQLQGIKSTPMGFGETQSLSLPDAVATIMKEFNKPPILINILSRDRSHSDATDTEPLIADQQQIIAARLPHYDICPDCGNASLTRRRNCRACDICGFSSC